MKHDYRISRTFATWFFAAWVAGAVLTGGILTSFHQPFRLPDAQALSVVLAQSAEAQDSATPQWKVTHLLSGGCGCSRRVMDHLIERREVAGVSEQIVMVDGGESYLPGTGEVLASLERSGYKVRHVTDEDLEAKFNLHGVPMLLVATAKGKLVYLGGYGMAGDEYDEIFRKVSSGATVAPLPVLGCAIGRRNRRGADPFRLKY